MPATGLIPFANHRAPRDGWWSGRSAVAILDTQTLHEIAGYRVLQGSGRKTHTAAD